MRLGVVALAGVLALSAAAAAAGSQHATPRPVSFTCKITKGVAVVVDPRRRHTTVTDAGRTADQYGQPAQDPSTNRLVATMTARGVSFFAGCKRAPNAKRHRTSHLIGPWPARVFSRVLCSVGGPDVRFDAFPLRGGGYRLSVAWQDRRIPYSLVSTSQQPRSRGGLSFDMNMCTRLSK